jgi:hypothetical protein
VGGGGLGGVAAKRSARPRAPREQRASTARALAPCTAQAPRLLRPPAPGYQHRGRPPVFDELRDDVSFGEPCVRKLQAPRGGPLSSVGSSDPTLSSQPPLGVTPLGAVPPLVGRSLGSYRDSTGGRGGGCRRHVASLWSPTGGHREATCLGTSRRRCAQDGPAESSGTELSAGVPRTWQLGVVLLF